METHDELGIRVKTTKNPRADAPTYELSTISDIVDAVTIDSIPRFLIDFEAFLTTAIAMQDALAAFIEANDPHEGVSFKGTITAMTWIDDHPLDTPTP